ncbi:MAG: HPP family protein [Candidatus Eremiobacteraeota bacterium]|nr:HPP family protein [Candidatus Eremiobacteraeota bacterium]
MRLFDKKFRNNTSSYILQSLLATIAIIIIMRLLDVLTQTTIVASMGASSFTLFAMPHSDNASPRRVIGGTLVGVIVGCACWYVSQQPEVIKILLSNRNSAVLAAAVAVGLAIFIMVITDTEHPPAAGVAMGFVLNPWNQQTVWVVILGITFLSLINRGLKNKLKDLI